MLRLIRDLFAHEQQSTGTDLKVALNHLVHVLHRRSIVMLMSDFMDEGFEPSLRAVSRRHDTIAVHLTDPVESELPEVGLMEVTDAESGERVLIDTSDESVRSMYEQEARSRKLSLTRMFRRLKVDTIPIVTDEGYVDPLIRFFRQRNRMINA